MDVYGVHVDMINKPALDEDFLPLAKFNESFLKDADCPLEIALERDNGQISTIKTYIHGTPSMKAADLYYTNRLIKTMLWARGGFRIYLCGPREIYEEMAQDFSASGSQGFDAQFMASIYEHTFEVVYTNCLPEENSVPVQIGGHMDGCRIGFDAGGSDRKVSAVMNGEVVFSKETLWFPKENADPEYHYRGIVESLREAARHLPRVDAVGISSAGIYINNRTMSASLFRKVPMTLQETKIRNIYERAVRDTLGDVPFQVANDGDVSALALGKPSTLGIAMGTSEAGGYINPNGCITGWLNEFAFMPVDARAFGAPKDEWSGDVGCGGSYFSQDAVIRLAEDIGIEWNKELSPAEKLHEIQKMVVEGNEKARNIFRTIGMYLGHTIPLYLGLYACRNILLLGRVMSGLGGELLLESAQNTLFDEYPDIAEEITISLPDEAFRRLGQSVIAATLPQSRGTSE